MIFVKHIESNVKVGVNVELGPKTLVIGPNGSGKSTLVNALELALSSRASDIAGKVDIGKEADLFALAPARSGEMHAVATLSDGSIASWATTGSSAKAKKAAHTLPESVDPDAVFPLRALRDTFRSPDAAREFFVKQLSSVALDDVQRHFPTALREGLTALLPKGVPPVSALLLALQSVGERKRDASAQVKSAEKVLQAQGSGLPPEPTASQLAEAQRLAASLQSQLEDAARNEAAVSERGHLRGEYEATKVRLEQLLAQLPPGTTPGDVRPIDNLQALLHTLRANFKLSPTTCLVCEAPVALDQLERRGRDVAATLEQRSALPALVAQITQVQQRLQAIERRMEMLGGGAVPAAFDSVAAREQLAAAQAKVTELSLTRGKWDAVRKGRDVAAGAAHEVNEWKERETALETALGAVLDSGVSELVARVQAFLPATDRFFLRLRDGLREVCEFGLDRDGVPHKALSGAEWARVQAAMASAFSKPGKLSVVVPEDRSWDAATLSEVLVALTNAPCQVVLATTTEPTTIPAGWKVIRVGPVTL